MEEFDETKLKKQLQIDARGLNIPPGAADTFINQTIKSVKKTLSPKKLITKRDLDKAVIKELKKYHADFAYVYENRDKIV